MYRISIKRPLANLLYTGKISSPIGVSYPVQLPAYNTRYVAAHYLGFRLYSGNFKYTVGAIIKKWNEEFARNEVPEPKLSAEYIVAHVLNTKDISDVKRDPEKQLSQEDISQIEQLCNKRLERMPVQYIIQEWDFRDLTLKMSRPVFIPRPETETLVDIVLNDVDARNVGEVLELGCGSGAVSLALLKSRPHLRATAVDKLEDACRLAEENAERNGLSDRLKVVHSEVDENFDADIGSFDVIVSNPPYVPTEDMIYLQPEITRYEDLEALDGGGDGLAVIKFVLKACSRLLNYRGKLFLEVDPSHPTLIKSWLRKNGSLGLVFLRSFTDLHGRERFVEIMKEK